MQSLPNKPPKPQLLRDRDTTERDLNFDDIAQDHRQLMTFAQMTKLLELARDKRHDPETVKTLIEMVLAELAGASEAERDDLSRHHTRASILGIKRREEGGAK